MSGAGFSLRGLVLARTEPPQAEACATDLAYFFPFVTSFCTRQLFMSAM